MKNVFLREEGAEGIKRTGGNEAKKTVVPCDQKFRLQNTKRAENIMVGRKNLGPNFCQIYQKMRPKRGGRDFF
jgi:hypothetical protein